MTPDPPPVGTMQLYDSVTPGMPSGSYRVTSTVRFSPDKNGADPNLTTAVHRDFVDVGGSALHLAATEVLSCHPPKNATGAFDQELPHVVLRRRTLPWERPGATASPPWLALLVFLDSEVTFSSGTLQALFPDLVSTLGAGGPEPVDVVKVNDPAVLSGVLPTSEEAALLTHVRRVNTVDTALDMADDDGWLAVVVANRLPIRPDSGPGLYHACLVSLEGRGDLYARTSSEIILLYRWDFVTDSDGTFEKLAQGLDIGTLGQAQGVTDTDGRTPLALTAREGAAGTGLYRGPFTVSAAGAAADESDVSYDAAYELGRLLGAADATLCRELVQWHRASLISTQTTIQNSNLMAAATRMSAGTNDLGEHDVHVHAAAAGLHAMLGLAAPPARRKRRAPRSSPKGEKRA
jgi:hypothetical protein